MKTLILALMVALASVASGEDYQCTWDAGCTARINRDGELTEVQFRRGDIVSTGEGWIVSTDDGWRLIETRPRRQSVPQLRGSGVTVPMVVLFRRPSPIPNDMALIGIIYY